MSHVSSWHADKPILSSFPRIEIVTFLRSLLDMPGETLPPPAVSAACLCIDTCHLLVSSGL